MVSIPSSCFRTILSFTREKLLGRGTTVIKECFSTTLCGLVASCFVVKSERVAWLHNSVMINTQAWKVLWSDVIFSHHRAAVWLFGFGRHVAVLDWKKATEYNEIYSIIMAVQEKYCNISRKLRAHECPNVVISDVWTHRWSWAPGWYSVLVILHRWVVFQ